MEAPLVEIAQGRLKGCIRTDFDGEKFFAYFGVPYAKPPVGELRFKAPQPAVPWEGTRHCIHDTDRCLLRDILDGYKLKGSEDCLYLNVYTKSVTPDILKHVLVYIHGGGFVSGCKDCTIYGPEFLITEDIVIVSINYRLGILGFLSLEDPDLDVPGNAGLKDQNMALRWVQQNIEKFGGDPNKVTLGGVSAGGCSVHYQTLAPMSQGLFKRAVAQSGYTLTPWAVNKNSVIDMLKASGIEANDEKEALEYLMNVSGGELLDIQVAYIATKSRDVVVFGPVIEKPNPTAFITEHPKTLIAAGKWHRIPIMFGYCNREGLLTALNKRLDGPNALPDETLEEKVARVVKLSVDDDFVKEWVPKIRELYFESGDPEADTVFDSDFLFIYAAVTSAELCAKTSKSPVYLYQFSIDAGLNLLKKIGKLTNPGAGHGDDVGYLFKTMYTPEIESGSFEETAMRSCVTMYTNFMKYGNPTPPGNILDVTWKPVETGVTNYMDICESLKPCMNPSPGRMNMWREFWQSLETYVNQKA